MIHDNYAAGDKPRVQQPDYFKPNSSGMVLVVVVILAAVAGILAAGLHFASGSRITQVRQEMRFEKAFFVAEAGIERAKANLRTNVTSSVLFGGFMNYGEGRFYVNVQSNSSGTNLFIIRSTGIVENATQVIEAKVQVIPFVPPQNADGAFGIYGTNSSLDAGGKILDGHDYEVPADFDCNGAACTVDVPTTNPAVAGVYSATNADITGTIDGHPPITNGVSANYSETYWLQIYNALASSATTYNGGNMGTRTAPIVTILPPITTSISGGDKVAGAGILIIPGSATLKVQGTFHYEGLVILMGDGAIDFENDLGVGGTVDIYGVIVCVGDNLDVTTSGSARIKYSTEALANLINLPPVPARLDMIYWKEIKASSTDW